LAKPVNHCFHSTIARTPPLPCNLWWQLTTAIRHRLKGVSFYTLVEKVWEKGNFFSIFFNGLGKKFIKGYKIHLLWDYTKLGYLLLFNPYLGRRKGGNSFGLRRGWLVYSPRVNLKVAKKKI
jgi:hypothetical protein